MDIHDIEWLRPFLEPVRIPSEDFPDIELYMDQITTFMDTKLDKTRRYPDDKILTKTMINNYTKNHLLPPSVKKKYSREHLYLLIFIYHLKNMLSISDIQTLLGPVTEKYFKETGKSGLTLKEIYDQTMNLSQQRHASIEADIQEVLDQTAHNYDGNDLTEEEKEYMDSFSFIYQLCYDIYVRKQLIERYIDHIREEQPAEKGRKKKAK